MKRLLLIFALLLLFLLCGCRHRIMRDAEQVVYETYLQETPVTEPTEASTEPTTEAPEETITEPSEEPEPSTEPPEDISPSAPPVQESTPAEGGATEPSTEPTEPEEAIEVTVTLDANKGTCPQESLVVQVGTSYGSLPVAERSGFTFTGWYDRKNGGTRVDAASVVIATEDHTLYAHWSARSSYAVIFDPNGGRLASEDAERLVCSGDPYGELPVPIRRGYDFVGWYTAAEGGNAVQATDIFTGAATQYLYAHWSYNPFDYWSFFLENTTQQVYSCQQRSVYLEFDTDYVTTNYCSLISATGSFNVAQYREDMNVTDEWVYEKNPDVIVKVISDMGSAGAAYSAMAARFPGYYILVVPSAAVYGSAAQTLYYQIYFGKLLYPEWYTGADLNTVGAELGVSGSIYG